MAVTPQTVQELTRYDHRVGWFGVVLDFCRRRPLGAIGAAIILVMVALAATAGWIAPYHPLETDYGAMLAAPDARHWLGTDAFGRDVLSRIIYGSRTALLVGLGASLLGATLGSLIGVASAYFGGRVDLIVQRIMDVFFAFPVIILALAVVAVLGTGPGNVILAIAVPMVPRCALVIRSSALAIREMPLVDAADAAGFGHARMAACGYSLGATYRPSWMDVPPMLYFGNETPAEPGMVLFMHAILANADAMLAMSLGHTVVVTEAGAEVLSRHPLEHVVRT